MVDDRIPFDDRGRPLVPRSTAEIELWPMIIAKALYKLGVRSGGAAAQDLAVPMRLTGWTPQLVPILPTMPCSRTPS